MYKKYWNAFIIKKAFCVEEWKTKYGKGLEKYLSEKTSIWITENLFIRKIAREYYESLQKAFITSGNCNTVLQVHRKTGNLFLDVKNKFLHWKFFEIFYGIEPKMTIFSDKIRECCKQM